MRRALPFLVPVLVLAVGLQGQTQDVTFAKTRYSTVKQPNETDVRFVVGDSKMTIDSKKVDRKSPATIHVEIPYSSLDSVSYELAARHRVAEGAAVMALSLGAGAILMATKTKSHWLAVEYHEGEVSQTVILRLDKSEYEAVIAAVEARTGKSVVRLDSKTSTVLNPTAGSKDVDQVVPFESGKVAVAVKAAMDHEGCKVSEESPARIECKRGRGASEQTGSGGESVTAFLEAKGDETHIRIVTGLGVLGRAGKKNWSTPVYQSMLKELQPARR